MTYKILILSLFIFLLFLLNNVAGTLVLDVPEYWTFQSHDMRISDSSKQDYLEFLKSICHPTAKNLSLITMQNYLDYEEYKFKKTLRSSLLYELDEIDHGDRPKGPIAEVFNGPRQPPQYATSECNRTTSNSDGFVPETINHVLGRDKFEDQLYNMLLGNDIQKNYILGYPLVEANINKTDDVVHVFESEEGVKTNDSQAAELYQTEELLDMSRF